MKDITQQIFDEAINIYCYGSYVYGTFKEGVSDKDYIIIIPDNSNYAEQIKYNNSDFNFYKESDWIKKMKNNDVECLECEFLEEKYILKQSKKYEFCLNKDLVRKNISSTASNSYVKCKKKLIVEDSYNPKVGKKSLWHALRLLQFGIQIMTNNKIYDYKQANYYYNDIINLDNNWEAISKKYKPIYNKLKSEFRIEHNKILNNKENDYDR